MDLFYIMKREVPLQQETRSVQGRISRDGDQFQVTLFTGP